jgi:hypothetical protein
VFSRICIRVLSQSADGSFYFRVVQNMLGHLIIYDVLSVCVYICDTAINFSSNVYNTKARLCRMSTALKLTIESKKKGKGIQKNQVRFHKLKLLVVDLEDIHIT